MYNPDIGDGRGFLFAQLRDEQGRDCSTSAPRAAATPPTAARADGRLTLKGGMREVLATEMLEALGVNTSKSFALFETGEQLVRGDEPSPTRSAVLTRLSHGHIRIGTSSVWLSPATTDGDRAGLSAIASRISTARLPAGGCRQCAAAACSSWRRGDRGLAASYMAAGFVHGVLNSDNINITGESFDYGPWRFTPDWDGEFIAAYFDHYRSLRLRPPA